MTADVPASIRATQAVALQRIACELMRDAAMLTRQAESLLVTPERVGSVHGTLKKHADRFGASQKRQIKNVMAALHPVMVENRERTVKRRAVRKGRGYLRVVGD